MKLRLSILAALCAAFFTGAPSALADSARVYYVSLGDSLAVGGQPKRAGCCAQGPTTGVGGGETTEGYVEQLAALVRETNGNLRVKKFGCGGESTRTMRFGRDPQPFPPAQGDNLCQYGHGSQLNDAVAFLAEHPGEIAFVTIDVGAGDAGDLGVDAGLVQVQQNLPVILSALRAASGPDVPIIGMNYYSPFIVAWFHDPALAQAIVDGTVRFNNGLEAIYQAAGSPVADIETAFSMTDFTIQPDGLPLNVERVCEWTWMCAVGDVHPNKDGYGAIARAFVAALGAKETP
jgi:lysophospholipase L1-like esterase